MLDVGWWSTPRSGRFIAGKDPVPINKGLHYFDDSLKHRHLEINKIGNKIGLKIGYTNFARMDSKKKPLKKKVNSSRSGLPTLLAFF